MIKLHFESCDNPNRVWVYLGDLLLCGATFDGNLFNPDFSQEYSNIGDPDLSQFIRTYIKTNKENVINVQLPMTYTELSVLKKYRTCFC